MENLAILIRSSCICNEMRDDTTLPDILIKSSELKYTELTGTSSFRSWAVDHAWSFTRAHSTGLPKFFCSARCTMLSTSCSHHTGDIDRKYMHTFVYRIKYHRWKLAKMRDKCRGRQGQGSTLKLSVKIRCASLNSGVEKESRGSSFFFISSSCINWCSH